jgi:hypothetical protein
MTVAASVAPPRAAMSLPARLAGVITSPRETFAAIVAHPNWLGALVVILLISAACAVGLQMTEVGKQALLDAQVRQMEAFGREVDDRTYAAMERGLRLAPVFTAVGILVGAPIITAGLAGILFAVFSAGLGGEGTYRQAFAVTIHAGAVSTLGQIFSTPLMYIRESMSSPTNLSVFLPMLDENGMLARTLGAVDFFIAWWVVVLAIGFGVLYRRPAAPIAATLLAIYGVIAVTIGFVFSRGGT